MCFIRSSITFPRQGPDMPTVPIDIRGYLQSEDKPPLTTKFDRCAKKAIGSLAGPRLDDVTTPS